MCVFPYTLRHQISPERFGLGGVEDVDQVVGDLRLHLSLRQPGAAR